MACLYYRWVEFDVLYMEGHWKLCHDSKKLRPHTETIQEVVSALTRMQKKTKLIVDIKWDFLYNHPDDIDKALGELRKCLLPLQCSIYIQSIVPDIVYRLHHFFPNYPKGIVLPSCPLLKPETVDYIMADIHQWKREDIVHCHLPVFGYTCSTREDMNRFVQEGYKDILSGMVCDIPEN